MRETSGSTTKGVAKRMLRTREGDVEHGIVIDPKRDKVTFDDAAADLITEYTVNKRKSLNSLDGRLRKHLLPVFGGRRLAAITTADVRRYVAARQAEIRVVRKARRQRVGKTWVEIPAVTRAPAAAQINRELAILKRILYLAIEGDKLTRAIAIPMLREHNVRTGFFERAQFDAVLARLPAEVQPDRRVRLPHRLAARQ